MDLVGGNSPGTPNPDATPQSQQGQGQPFVNPNPQSVGAPMAVNPANNPNPGTSPEAPPPQMPAMAPAMPPVESTPSVAPPNPLDTVSDMGLSSEPSGPVGGKGKVIAMVAVGSVLVLGMVAGAFFIGQTTGKSEGRRVADHEYQQREADRQRQDAEQRSSEEEARLELGSDTIDPKYVDETIEGDIGKQLTASDGFVFKVTNIQRNFVTDDPNYKPNEEKELIKVNFLMGNIAKDKVKDMTNAAFYLEDSQSARLNPENIVSYEGKFDTIKLDSGMQESGSIIYAVAKDETPLKFVREQRYRFAGENKEVTTRIVVNVAQ